jgi:6-pyruvoyltetrahydropterin/6-carboxytetrahydropterin synthase
MVIDFSDIKAIAKGTIDDLLDHGYMYQKGDEIGALATKLGQKTVEVEFVPTSENIVKYVFNLLDPLFIDKYNNQLRLLEIKLYETPNSYVVYTPHANK